MKKVADHKTFNPFQPWIIGPLVALFAIAEPAFLPLSPLQSLVIFVLPLIFFGYRGYREAEKTRLIVNAQKEILDKLKSAQDRLQVVLDTTPIVLWSADKEGIITYSQGSGLLGMGVTSEQLVGTSIYDNYRYRPQEIENVKRAYTGEMFTIVTCINSIWFETSFFPIYDENDDVNGVVGLSTDITARKATQEEQLRHEIIARTSIQIQETQNFLNSLIENLPSTVFVKDAKDLSFIQMNRAAEQLFGHTREDMIGKTDYDFFPKAQAEFFQSKDREVLKSLTTISVEEEALLTKDGDLRIVRTKKTPILDAQGNAKYLMGISDDITDLKQIRIERDQFFTSSLDMMIITGNDGFFKSVNPVVHSILGYTPEEFCKFHYTELIHPEDLERTNVEVAKQTQGGSVYDFENRYLCKDGSYRWISWKAVAVDDKFYGCGRDVTEERANKLEIERLNRDLKERFDGVSSSNMMAIMFWDAKGAITEANDAFLKLIGYTREELDRGEIDWAERTPPDHKYKDDAALKLLAADGAVKPYEKEYYHKDGTRIPILIGVAVLDKKNMTGVCFALDLTEIKRAEQERNAMQLKAQEAIAASNMKSTFLANMSHEIRTPINGVLGTTGLLLDTQLTSEQRKYGEVIRGSADTLLTLINDILDLSRAEAGEIVLEEINFDLNQVVNDVEGALTYAVNKKNLQLIKHIDPSLPAYLKGDPTRVTQILMNLVSNAVKFTSSGKIEIRILAGAGLDSKINLKIEVTDTGIGIPEQSRDLIFRAFTQADTSTSRRFGGSGLGLSICKHLVQIMGGEIGVHSEVGKGSTFWFKFPIAIGESSLSSKSNSGFETVVPTRRLRILLAEDNPTNQMIALKMLDRMGHKATAVGNGLQVIDALRKDSFDMILMDCQMPELDGYQATQHIRENSELGFQKIPIVAMTANAMKGDREKCLDAGMDDYLAKPMKFKDMAAIIDRNAK